MERLQKVIASSGVASRRKAEELIVKGKVKVDGIVVKELGTKVTPKNKIEVDNVLISNEVKVYYLLNKPRGVITSTKDDKHRETVVDLIDTNLRIYPIGRLDYDTTGVLLLTNDGEFANNVMHPKCEIEKTYVAKVKGLVTPDKAMALRKGVDIDGYITKPAKVKVSKRDIKTGTSMVEITIHEGKNHQVKRMFEQVDLEVVKLKRESVAFLTVDGLKSGEYRQLTNKEVSQLYTLTQNMKS